MPVGVTVGVPSAEVIGVGPGVDPVAVPGVGVASMPGVFIASAIEAASCGIAC